MLGDSQPLAREFERHMSKSVPVRDTGDSGRGAHLAGFSEASTATLKSVPGYVCRRIWTSEPSHAEADAVIGESLPALCANKSETASPENLE